MNLSTDPIDQLHQFIWQAHRRSRFWLREDPRQVLARRVEDDIAGRLRDRGHVVAHTGHNDRFDLLVAGVRIEVKAATWSGGRYQFALRSNDADVLVLGCHTPSPFQGEGRGEGLCYSVIPFDQVRGLTNIAIWTADPQRYTGRWRRYLEAWSLLDELIARGVNHWQMQLPESEPA